MAANAATKDYIQEHMYKHDDFTSSAAEAMKQKLDDEQRDIIGILVDNQATDIFIPGMTYGHTKELLEEIMVKRLIFG
jgi:hypothetical protein